MLIGIVSDTHMRASSAKLPLALVEGLKGVDRILHAGDFVSLEVAELLEQIAPLEAVAGNNDGSDIIMRYGLRKIVELDGVRIGLVHGDGYGRTTERRAFDAFAEDRVDVIVFGHSHIPYKEEKEGILLFNPGSPTDKRRQPLFSFGLMEIREGKVLVARHIYYEDKS